MNVKKRKKSFLHIMVKQLI